jgi:hypothetical protein
MTTSMAVTPRGRAIALGCAALGALWLATALAMAVDPAGFIDQAGGFGAVNEHLVRDLATYSAAVGAGLLIAWRVPSWRVPVLAFATLQTALHTVNHMFDADLADPGWKGWGNAAVLAALTLVTAWLMVAAHRENDRA